jgi:hypothetical protein
VTPKDVWHDANRRSAYQYRLLARGTPIFWWSDVAFEDDTRRFIAVHLASVNGIFRGDATLARRPAVAVAESSDEPR